MSLSLYSDETIKSFFAKHRHGSTFADAELAAMYGEEIRRRKAQKYSPKKYARAA